MTLLRLVPLAVLITTGLAVHAEEAKNAPAKPLSMQDILDASKPSDWRALDPQHTLYLDLPAGRVVIDAPDGLFDLET